MSTGDQSFSVNHDAMSTATGQLPGQSSALASVRQNVLGSKADAEHFGKVPGSSSAASAHGDNISAYEKALADKVNQLDDLTGGINDASAKVQSFDQGTAAGLTEQQPPQVPELTGSSAAPEVTPETAPPAATAEAAPPAATPETTPPATTAATAPPAATPETVPPQTVPPQTVPPQAVPPATPTQLAPTQAAAAPTETLPTAPAAAAAAAPPPATPATAAPEALQPISPTAEPVPTLTSGAGGAPVTATDYPVGPVAGTPLPTRDGLPPADPAHPGVSLVTGPDGKQYLNIYPNDRKVPSFPLPNTAGETGGYQIHSPAWDHDPSHTYNYESKTPVQFDQYRGDFNDSVVHNPTAHDKNPATPMGTYNNANGFVSSGVMSYVVPSPDPANSTDLVVNYTVPSHDLYPGYVVRRVYRDPVDGTAVVQTYGEGTSSVQSGVGGFFLGTGVHDIWMYDNRSIANEVLRKHNLPQLNPAEQNYYFSPYSMFP